MAQAIREVPGLAKIFEPATPWNEIPLAIVDFETTGTDASQDRIIEVGIIGFDRGEVTFRESILIHPEMPIPEESRAVHGITDEELEGAPPFRDAFAQIAEVLEGRLPVAYNANFDRGFLHAEAGRNQKHAPAGPLPPAFQADVHWLDPLVWAREILTELKSKRLGKVAEHFGIPLEQAHRAAGDAEATGHVLMALAPQMPTAYGELIRLQTRYGAMQEAQFARFRRNR